MSREGRECAQATRLAVARCQTSTENSMLPLQAILFARVGAAHTDRDEESLGVRGVRCYSEIWG